MTDLFAFGRASEAGYGLSGDMKKTQYVLQLLGTPDNTDTLKCLLTAAEVGLETDCATLDIAAGADKSAQYLDVSPFGMVPALKEADYYVAGASGVMSYIEARGLGKRLRPQNAQLLAEQNFWADIASTEVQPHVEALLRENVLKPADSRLPPDEKVAVATRDALKAPLQALNAQLTGKTFIIGDFSFADIHWTACLHLLHEAGGAALIESQSEVRRWFEQMRQHKSFSGQAIIPFELLPTRNEIIEQQLKSVVIDDY